MMVVMLFLHFCIFDILLIVAPTLHKGWIDRAWISLGLVLFIRFTIKWIKWRGTGLRQVASDWLSTAIGIPAGVAIFYFACLLSS
jgi:hypothetical protein